MGKALTKEDLIYILQAVLTLSQLPTNALHRKDDGLYVEDYHADLEAHTSNGSIHVTQQILDTLARIGINENDELTYDGKQLMTYISKAEHNGLVQKDDGYYVPALRISQEACNALIKKDDGLFVKDTDASQHINNDSIHVTQDDKDNWDGMLDEANDYTDQEIAALPIHDFCFVTQLPATGQDETMLYFLANDPERCLECTYVLCIWRDGAWHTLGITNRTLKDYVTKQQFIDDTKQFFHGNQSILDALGEDANGILTYNGKGIFNLGLIDADDTNAIEIRNGKLYVRDYTQEIVSMVNSTQLVKTNLYNEEISESGKYKLKDTIDNYNLILVEYYYKPNDVDPGTPGCIQTAVIDPDTLNEAYSQGMLYILQYGYGVMTSNSQIHIVGDELTVDYYHNVCIYKITGIRKGGNSDGE